GANIVSIEHNRKSAEVLRHYCSVTFVLETTDALHKESLIQQLQKAGYDLTMKMGELVITEQDNA
ncbi:MAG: hypothetical protein ACK5LZ_07025, partial [Anaerorhabdus sp.]